MAIYYAGMAVTFKQLDDMSNRFANFVKEQGLKPGDVVGVNLPHRIGTIEVENALVSHPAVVEAAVTGVPDDMRAK